MLLAGALTLAVPVIGWQSVSQLDASLQKTRIDAQTLKVANARVALAEAADLQALLEASRATDRLNDVYAESASLALFEDGYDDDWQTLKSASMPLRSVEQIPATSRASFGTPATSSMRLAQRGNRLFIFMDVRDKHVVYHVPPQLRADAGEEERPDSLLQLVNGDALELYIQEPGSPAQHVLFRAIAPGPLTGLVASAAGHARLTGQRPRQRSRNDPEAGSASMSTLNDEPGQAMPDYRGVWVANQRGYQLELNLPLPAIGSSFGIAVIDVRETGETRDTWMGTLDPETMRRHRRSGKPLADAGRLFHTARIAAARLAPWVTPGVRARLFDRQGRLLADVNALYEKTGQLAELDPQRGSLFNALLFRSFSYFVSSDSAEDQSPITLRDALHLSVDSGPAATGAMSATSRYITADNDRVLGTLLPIGGAEPNGFLLLESNEDLASAYADNSLARLFSLLTLVSVLAGTVLLMYASWLSLRIRRLSTQARLAVADDGQVTGLPGSDAQDEIGDLSRNLSALLERSANYTQYLEALSSRLSHELRTPLSVVRTSIENMDRELLDNESLALLDRASGGADQLGAIIRALVESTRLEQTVQQAQMVEVDMQAWVTGALARYSQIHPEYQFLPAGSLQQLAAHSGSTLSDETALERTQLSGQEPGAHSQIMLRAAPELLLQAVDKLVDNAVEFSRFQLVSLVVSVQRVGDQQHVLIAVANHGAPIAENRLSQLFDPMYSERPETSEGNLHLGLGLYIVRMIAEAHGGRAVAMNIAPHVVIGMSLPLLPKASSVR